MLVQFLIDLSWKIYGLILENKYILTWLHIWILLNFFKQDYLISFKYWLRSIVKKSDKKRKALKKWTI